MGFGVMGQSRFADTFLLCLLFGALFFSLSFWSAPPPFFFLFCLSLRVEAKARRICPRDGLRFYFLLFVLVVLAWGILDSSLGLGGRIG